MHRPTQRHLIKDNKIDLLVGEMELAMQKRGPGHSLVEGSNPFRDNTVKWKKFCLQNKYCHMQINVWKNNVRSIFSSWLAPNKIFVGIYGLLPANLQVAR